MPMTVSASMQYAGRPLHFRMMQLPSLQRTLPTPRNHLQATDRPGTARSRERDGSSRVLEAAWRCSSPMRIGRSGSREFSKASQNPDKTGRQKATSASYQTYRHARASTITTRTIIKLISAHKLSIRLSPLLLLRMVVTSLQTPAHAERRS